MKIVSALLADEQKIIDWAKRKEPQFIKDITASVNVVNQVLAWRKSATGTAVISVLEAEIPAAVSAVSGTVAMITALATDMAAASNPASWEGIGLRLGAEILSLLDGGKLPTGIDGYIAEIQTIFVG